MVLGDGPEKEALQQQVSNLQLGARVVFLRGTMQWQILCRRATWQVYTGLIA